MATKILPLPARDRVLELLDYDFASGVFRWRQQRGPVRSGAAAGVINRKGYRYIRIDGVLYRAHRIAWLIVHGVDPGLIEIDHMDGDRDNNAASNLRLVTTKQNQENRGLNRNNSSGHRGVYWSNRSSCWVAEICHNRETKRVAGFSDAHSASVAAQELRKNFFTHDTGRSNDSFAP